MSELKEEKIHKFYDEKETFMSKSSQFTLQITGAALFGALSLVLSAFTTSILPRIPGWGIAFIDPVSMLWVMCFLIFGTKAGLLCCVIGTLGLMPFDSFAPIGPLMKLSATLALIIMPIILLRLYKQEKGVRNSQKIKKIVNYTTTGIIGILLRIVVMMYFNVFLFLTFLSDIFPYTNLEYLGLPDVTGWTAIVITVIFINAEQSLWDLIIPYLIVFGLKLDERFEVW